MEEEDRDSTRGTRRMTAKTLRAIIPRRWPWRAIVSWISPALRRTLRVDCCARALDDESLPTFEEVANYREQGIRPFRLDRSSSVVHQDVITVGYPLDVRASRFARNCLIFRSDQQKHRRL